MTPLEIPEDEIQISFARSSGPGGQSVNTSDTKAVLRWNVAANHSLPEDVRQRFLDLHAGRVTREGVLLLQCDTFRTQRRNLDACRVLLQRLVDEAAMPPKPRRPTRPSAASVQRRLDEKTRRAEIKNARQRPDPE